MVNQVGKASSAVIYGTDSISDVDTSDKLFLNKNASLAVMHKNDLERISESKFKLPFATVESLFETCPDFELGKELSAAYCSAVLIAPQIVLTAGHCISATNPCENAAFVVGYEDSLIKQSAPVIDQSLVYYCKKVINQKDDQVDVMDFALIELDRPTNLFPASLRFQPYEKIENKSSVYSIGYPLGAPKKMSTGIVRQAEDEESKALIAELDVFSGNSGSPVFDSKTHQLIGILSGGEEDFDFDKTKRCEKVRQCVSSECSGEFVVPIQKIMSFLHMHKESL